jgi:hypothetical protein
MQLLAAHRRSCGHLVADERDDEAGDGDQVGHKNKVFDAELDRTHENAWRTTL